MFDRLLDRRSAVIGALLGGAATIVLSGFLACEISKKSGASAKAGEKPLEGVSSPGLPAQTPEELKTVVASVDDVSITVADLQDRINKQSPYVRARYTSMEQKKDFLDNLVRFEVLAKEAKTRGYDGDPEVVRTMKQVMIQK